MTNGTYSWSFVTQIFSNVNQVIATTATLSKWNRQLNQ